MGDVQDGSITRILGFEATACTREIVKSITGSSKVGLVTGGILCMKF